MAMKKKLPAEEAEKIVIPTFAPKKDEDPQESEEFVIPQPAAEAAEPESIPEFIPQPATEEAPDEETGQKDAEPAEELPPAEDEAAEESEEEVDGWEEDDEEVPSHSSRKLRRVLLFCSILLAFTLCALILLCCAMSPLKNRLTRYEASQPEYVRDAVCELLFQDPDWGLLYDLAGVDSTAYEGKEEYISYMEAKVGDSDLICTETATGLSGDLRYLLSCDGETVAAFNLINEGEDENGFDVWNLSSVDVFFTRSEGVTVIKDPDHTVYINGIALDGSNTTVSVETLAENYLTDGLHGYRWEQQQIDGFLVTPVVEVLDEYNNPVPVTYSEETGIFSAQLTSSPEITEEESALVVDAARAQALFAIREIKITKLREFFSSGSDVYAQLCDTDPFAKTYQSYKIDEASISVTDYYRYSDSLFSAHVKLKMDVTVKRKTVKTYEVDTTYFFTKNHSGVYLVTDSIAEDLQKQVSHVRLTYMQDEQVLFTEMVVTTANALTAPEAVNEDGIAATGWGRLEADGSLTSILTANADGTFSPVEGQSLDVMILCPIFDTAEPE